MRVNSAFSCFFTNRLVVRSVPIAIGIAIFFITSSFAKHSDPDLRAKHVNLLIREIGHRLLLQAGDSTSRVLPVTEIREGTFLLGFENEFFFFNHDSLMALSIRLFPKTQFPSGYTVTVHDCLKAAIVYGFQISNTSRDILACTGRSQPRGCYTIEFAFPDFYETPEQTNIEQKKADIVRLPEELRSVKVDPQKAIQIPEEPKSTSDDDIDPRTEELKSFEANPQDTNPKLKEFKASTSGYLVVNLVWSGMLVLLSVTLLIGRFGKRLTPALAKNQDHAIVKESASELTALGKFLFDVKDQRLLLGSEVIGLTDKECKVLELLNQNFGELIPRETLMQKIWINEGVITGRSLDMFVSKLRKKLSRDPELSITNVHGKGYKLEIRGIQI
ncbi:MAG TPA: winged helix-turn-helix domain-containing protein [Cyclobacteriaceae bacterium]|nr:winged helix-turn-helix domain-containing protein [Cyclobacteriaceae bacterium]